MTSVACGWHAGGWGPSEVTGDCCAGCGPAGRAVGFWREVVGFKVVTAKRVSAACGLASPYGPARWRGQCLGSATPALVGLVRRRPRAGSVHPDGASALHCLPDDLLNEFSSEVVFWGL